MASFILPAPDGQSRPYCADGGRQSRASELPQPPVDLRPVCSPEAVLSPTRRTARELKTTRALGPHPRFRFPRSGPGGGRRGHLFRLPSQRVVPACGRASKCCCRGCAPRGWPHCAPEASPRALLHEPRAWHSPSLFVSGSAAPQWSPVHAPPLPQLPSFRLAASRRPRSRFMLTRFIPDLLSEPQFPHRQSEANH